jgi:membrane-bound lytic murein transglycosylase D
MMMGRALLPVLAAILLNACATGGAVNRGADDAASSTDKSEQSLWQSPNPNTADIAESGAGHEAGVSREEGRMEEPGTGGAEDAGEAVVGAAVAGMINAGSGLEDPHANAVPDTLRPRPKSAGSPLSREINDEVYDFQFEKNFDSLLNVYYINRALEQVIDDAAFETRDSLLPDFPDSVYIERLSNIPSVIDLSYNRLVKNYINVYTIKRRDQVRSMLAIADYYFPMFEQVFDLYGVPYELKYLAVIESALNPRAVSRAGAVGTWQFMHGTARAYSLRINSLVDERRDPLAATHAAAKFLRSLYGIYGDWTMALAAYNCGPGNVNKAIRRSGGKRDFWEIYYYLPRETRGYVPAFIAATYAMNYHREHLLNKLPMEIELYTDTILLNRKLHLMQVAEVLDIPVQQLRDLNPQYRYDIIPATPKELYSLALPLSKTGAFIDLQDSIMAYKDSVYLHNDKMNASPVSRASLQPADLPADKYDKLLYTVKSGDNLGFIADWYDVRLSDIRYWNNISHNLIRSGQKLVIYKPKGGASKYKDVNTMTFSQKQVFAGRAVSGTTTAAVAATTAGGVPGSADASGANQTGAGSVSSSSAVAGDDGEFITYTVRSGDTLWDIAKKFPGVTDTDISRWNNFTSSSKIQPGQKIRIRKI